jgi:rubrerythrin
MKEEAQAHYQRLAEAVDDKAMKQIFSLLAAAEEEHVQTLSAMNKHLTPTSAEGVAFSEKACVFRPLLNSGNLGKELQKDSDAFNHVVAEEEQSIEFYEQLAQQSKDATMKKLCRKLADQERKHLDKISNIYSFVEDPRTYLEWGEFSNMKTL